MPRWFNRLMGRADAGVKTTDAWLSLGKEVYQVGIVWGGLAAALSWIATQWHSVTGGSWPASVFLGIGVSCSVFISLGALFAGLQYWRSGEPSANLRPSTEPDAGIRQPDKDAELKAFSGLVRELGDRIGRQGLDAERSIADTSKRLVRLEELLAPRSQILLFPTDTSRLDAIERRLELVDGVPERLSGAEKRVLTLSLILVRKAFSNAKAAARTLSTFTGLSGQVDPALIEKSFKDWNLAVHQVLQLGRCFDVESVERFAFSPASTEMSASSLAGHGRHLPDFIITDPPNAEGLRQLEPLSLYRLRLFWLQYPELEEAERQFTIRMSGS